jgi:hypothetical protein
MNVLNEALKIQANAIKEETKLEKAIQAKARKYQKELEAFKTFVTGLVDRFKEFDKMPIRYYQYSENGATYRYNEERWKTIDIEYSARGYNSHLSKLFQLYENPRNTETELKSVYIYLADYHMSLVIEETEGGPIVMKFTRRTFSFEEVKDLLLPYGQGWRVQKGSRPLSCIETEFTDRELAYKHIKGVILKIANIETLKELAEQTERKTVLAKYLNVDGIGSIEHVSNGAYTNPNGIVLKTNGKEYRVLNKSEVPSWYAFMVIGNVHKHSDLGLLADATGLKYEELKTMQTFGEKSFNSLVSPFVRNSEYGNEMAKKYSFSQYVVPVDNYFIVELGAI